MKCFCAATRRAARLLTRCYEEELRPSGVTPAQFEILELVSARPGLPQMDLVEYLAVDQTTLSRNLKLLADQRWLKRVASAKDRRQASYSLTADGRKALLHARPYWQRAQTQMEQTLGDKLQPVWSALQQLTEASRP